MPSETDRPISADTAESLLAGIARCMDEVDLVLVSDYNKGVCKGSMIPRLVQLAQAAGVPIVADPVKAVASGMLMNFVGDVESATTRIDGHLTDIMMAQDFHDLTGQVVAKVVALASELEDSLVRLLVQAAPPDQVQKVEQHLQGPVVDAEGRTDVVANQGEVDDLLASLGF